MRLKSLVLGLTLVMGMSLPAISQAYPDADHADTVPTLEDTIGHDHGTAVTTPADILLLAIELC